MSRWEEPDPRRLRYQEQALLSLCDRMTVLEQAFTAEIAAHQMTRKRLDHIQEVHKAEIASLRGEVAQLRGETRSILRIVGRET